MYTLLDVVQKGKYLETACITRDAELLEEINRISEMRVKLVGSLIELLGPF